MDDQDVLGTCVWFVYFVIFIGDNVKICHYLIDLYLLKYVIVNNYIFFLKTYVQCQVCALTTSCTHFWEKPKVNSFDADCFHNISPFGVIVFIFIPNLLNLKCIGFWILH